MMPEIDVRPGRPHQNSSDMSSTMMMAPAQLSVRPCIGVWMILKMVGQRNAAEDLAHLVDDRGVAHDEEAGDRGEGVRYAFGHGVGHLDAQVLLDAGGVDPRADQAHDDGGDDAVAAHPRVRQDVGDGGGVAAQRLDGARW